MRRSGFLNFLVGVLVGLWLHDYRADVKAMRAYTG